MFIMALILYSAETVPVRICFDSDPDGLLWCFEASMSVFFLGDVVLSFMTPFVNQNGQPMSDHVSIARNYLSGWFWVDVPSSVPVELLTLFLPADSETSALSALRFLRMFRLVRLLKLLKIQEHMNSAEEYLGVSLKPVRVLQLIILLCYVAHLLGCAWF